MQLLGTFFFHKGCKNATELHICDFQSGSACSWVSDISGQVCGDLIAKPLAFFTPLPLLPSPAVSPP